MSDSTLLTSAPEVRAPSRTALLVVIPCLDEVAHIGGLVRQLLDDDAGLALRVVVADGGSTDGTRDVVRGLAAGDERVVLLDNPGRIQSCAVNLAVAAFGDDVEFFARLDAHAGYPPEYLQTLLAEALDTGADSVVVAMQTVGVGTFQRAAAAAQNSPLGNGGSAHRSVAEGGTGKWVEHGHHALMRVEAYRAVEGYDETFTHNEDAELDVRLRAAGSRIWLTTRTWCVYHPRETPGALFRQYLNYGGGRARNVLKHRTVPRARQMAPLLVAPAIGVALVSRSRLLSVPALAWVLACLGYGAAMGAKERKPATGLAGVAAMIMHLGWSIGFWRSLSRSLLARRR